MSHQFFKQLFLLGSSYEMYIATRRGGEIEWDIKDGMMMGKNGEKGIVKLGVWIVTRLPIARTTVWQCGAACAIGNLLPQAR